MLAALEMNSQLLVREDLPEGLTELMKERQRGFGNLTEVTRISDLGFIMDTIIT